MVAATEDNLRRGLGRCGRCQQRHDHTGPNDTAHEPVTEGTHRRPAGDGLSEPAGRHASQPAAAGHPHEKEPGAATSSAWPTTRCAPAGSGNDTPTHGANQQSLFAAVGPSQLAPPLPHGFRDHGRPATVGRTIRLGRPMFLSAPHTAGGGSHRPPRRFASSASHSAAPSVSTPVPGAIPELSSRCRSVSGSNTGHGGSPPRLGLPVAANCTQ